MTNCCSRRQWLRSINEVDGDGPPQRHALWLLAAIILVGAALRISHLGVEPLTQDEAASWRFAHLTQSELWGPAGRFESSPPLYYSLQQMWLVFGESEAALRSISALFGTITIAVVYLIGRLVSGRTVALIAAALLATSGIHLHYSQEARAYALLMAATLFAVWGFLHFLRSWSDPDLWPGAATAAGRTGAASASQHWLGLAAYSFGTTVALYSHNTAFLLPALANIVVLYWWVVCAGRSRKFAVEWIIANLIPLALWLWWLPTVLTLSQGGGDFNLGWLKQPSIITSVRTLALVYGQEYFPFFRPWAKVIPVALLSLVGVWHFWHGRQPVAVVLLAFVVGVPILAYSAGLVARPILTRSVLLWSLGLGFVLIALGAVAIRDVRARFGVVGLVFFIQALNLLGYYTASKKPSWDMAVADLAESLRPGDGVVLIPLHGHWPFAYYANKLELPRREYGIHPTREHEHFFSRPGVDPDVGFPAVDRVDRDVTRLPIDGLGKLWQNHDRIWVILRWRGYTDRVLLANVEALGRITGHHDYGFDGFEMMLIVPGKNEMAEPKV
jgi:mannosyltransferase